jgi:hypothetical protein
MAHAAARILTLASIAIPISLICLTCSKPESRPLAGILPAFGSLVIVKFSFTAKPSRAGEQQEKSLASSAYEEWKRAPAA